MADEPLPDGGDAVAAEIQAADDKALEAATAFAVGKWGEYWQREIDAAQQRLEALYAQCRNDD